jgi:hypothetical protein
MSFSNFVNRTDWKYFSIYNVNFLKTILVNIIDVILIYIIEIDSINDLNSRYVLYVLKSCMKNYLMIFDLEDILLSL